MSAAGKLVGVGVGPGDPELITLKAVRVLEQADVVVHFAKSGTTGNARAIAQRYLRPGIREHKTVCGPFDRPRLRMKQTKQFGSAVRQAFAASACGALPGKSRSGAPA